MNLCLFLIRSRPYSKKQMQNQHHLHSRACKYHNCPLGNSSPFGLELILPKVFCQGVTMYLKEYVAEFV
jgi:hypothetical protein